MLAATALAGAPTVQAEPSTVEALCAAQTWPRPVPDVIGLMYEPYGERISASRSGGALGCWDDIRGVTPDGQDARRAAAGGWDTITAVSPPPGTLVERDQPITVHLAPIDQNAPKSFAPCDWVDTADVADIFGWTGPVVTDGYVQTGSVEPACTYRSPGRTAVLSRLYVRGAFAVDASAEYSLYPSENSTATDGLGLAATCMTDLHGAQNSRYNELVVLLDEDRLLVTQGLGAQPCDQLTEFAEAALEGIAR